MRRLPLAFVALALLLAPYASAAGAVTVGGFAFTPSTVTVAAGESVTWTWSDGFHSVVSDAGETWCDARSSGSCGRAFPTEGTFAYHCSIHPSMRGTVVVQAAQTQPEAETDAEAQPETEPEAETETEPETEAEPTTDEAARTETDSGEGQDTTPDSDAPRHDDIEEGMDASTGAPAEEDSPSTTVAGDDAEAADAPVAETPSPALALVLVTLALAARLRRQRR